MAVPRKSKLNSGKGAPSPSALDSEKRILQERQRQIDAKIAALNRTISEAHPSYQLRNRTGVAGGISSAPPASQRAGGPRRPPKKVVLRAEKQEGRMQTFALLIVVVGLILWGLYRYL